MAAYEGLDNCTIYDFETLSQDPQTGVVLSFAMLNYSEQRFIDNPYTYQELLNSAKMIKFDVQNQVTNYSRKIEKETLDWWSKQNEEAKKQLVPSADDKSIAELYSFFVVNRATNLEKIFTRRNTFDPIFMSSIMKITGNPEPYDWWTVRDTISFINGLSYGVELSDKFIPDGLQDSFVVHNPIHDIAMDVMRMQTLIQAQAI